MIIAGAGGHGLEMRYSLIQQGFSASEIYFFDEDATRLQRAEIGSAGIFEVEELRQHFINDPRFLLGVGNPIYREKLYHFLTTLGGSIYGISCVSNHSTKKCDSTFDAMPYSFIGPVTKIGLGVLINTRAHVHHECIVGDFSEIGPGAMLLGGSKIGRKCRIGAGAVILPGVELGDQVIVGAGAVVTKSIPSNCLIVGIPAKEIYKNQFSD